MTITRKIAATLLVAAGTFTTGLMFTTPAHAVEVGVHAETEGELGPVNDLLGDLEIDAVVDV